MRTATVTTKTSAEIASAFQAVFKTIKPASEVRRATPEERLAPYAKHVMKLRRQGLTWQQIATGMRQPPIGEVFSEKLLRTVLGVKERKPPAPPSDRLIMDPLTGKLTIVPAPHRP